MGYTTTQITGGQWYLIASNFQKTDGTSLDVSEFITGGITAGTTEANSPIIQFWDGAKLVTICYMEDMYDVDADDFIIGWGQPLAGETMKLEVEPGFGCWFRLPQTGAITCAGQVVALSQSPATLTANWQLIGNPYPTAININDSSKVDCSGLKAGTAEANSPLIQYWDGTKLVTICYMEDMYDEDADDFIIGWGQPLAGETMKLILNPCTGFWARDPNGGTIKFNL